MLILDGRTHLCLVLFLNFLSMGIKCKVYGFLILLMIDIIINSNIEASPVEDLSQDFNDFNHVQASLSVVIDLKVKTFRQFN